MRLLTMQLERLVLSFLGKGRRGWQVWSEYLFGSFPSGRVKETISPSPYLHLAFRETEYFLFIFICCIFVQKFAPKKKTPVTSIWEFSQCWSPMFPFSWMDWSSHLRSSFLNDFKELFGFPKERTRGWG